jgi:SAM-dependent methyltransferase
MTGPARCTYDDRAFVARCQQKRLRSAGLTEDLEQPTLTRMLPVVAGRDVLDVGCGDDAVARWLASCGARHVLGIDLSRRVLTLAAPPRCPPYGTVAPAPRPSPWQWTAWTWLSAASPCTTSWTMTRRSGV